MELDEDLLQQCWFLAGPTAVGKTALSLELASALPAEIVAMDSMTVYRGMDIGTAKASSAEQAAVPHHLLDLVDPHEEYSVAEYVEAAAAVAADIVRRGKTPLFVGGTGLYLRSLLRGVFAGPPANWPLRRELEVQAAEKGAQWLHNQLLQRDAESAARLHPNDQRRIIRAIEVVEATGQPLSAQHQQTPLPPDRRPQHVFWLEPPRDWLYQRINHRVQWMLDEGLIDEVRTLLARTPPPGRTARQGLGYKEVIDHLQGNVSLELMIDTIQTRTRQFAKRQHTWFRNLEECHAVTINGQETVDTLRQTVLDSRSR